MAHLLQKVEAFEMIEQVKVDAGGRLERLERLVDGFVVVE